MMLKVLVKFTQCHYGTQGNLEFLNMQGNFYLVLFGETYLVCQLMYISKAWNLMQFMNDFLTQQFSKRQQHSYSSIDNRVVEMFALCIAHKLQTQKNGLFLSNSCKLLKRT
eukprot:TRINITY_DN13181_c0_g2_i2.p1 TRINITY_DN13181_c0_g2~~TRINITY_DN13181_c0_g2_i2.p1  ORF type:complete len:111 (-),score=0.05 TRINITY_DN13181_c0_g2_i2:185-517(-)